MPANNHLEFFDIKKFGGLWTAGANSQMPADRAQIMSGCHPQPGGGLRAFLKVAATLDDSGQFEHSVLPAGQIPVSFGVSLKGADTSVTKPTLWLVTTSAPNSLQAGTATSTGATGTTGAAFLDLRASLRLSDWTPGTTITLVDRLVGNNGFRIQINTTGNIVLTWGTGAGTLTRTSTAAVTPDSDNTLAIRAELLLDNGAAGHTVNFYTSTADGTSTTWTALGSAVVTAGVTTLGSHTGTITLTVPTGGELYWVLVAANGIICHPDFTTAATGATSITDYFRDEVTWAVGSGSIAESLNAAGEPLVRNWQVLRSEDLGGWSASALANFSGNNSERTTPPPGQPSFSRYYDSAAAETKTLVGLSIREAAGTGSGVWEIDPHTGNGTRNVTGGDDAFGVTSLVEHQSRLVAGYKDTVIFTAPGGTDFAAAGSGSIRLNPQGFDTSLVAAYYDGAVVAWMVSVPPGDLVVATRDGRIYNVQGELSDPVVRELGRWTGMPSQEPVTTPHGIFFILANQGIATLGLDGSVDVISHDITPSVWNPAPPRLGLGQIAGTESFVFCPNLHEDTTLRNGALVYDVQTKAWFTSTHPDDHTIPNPRLMQPDNNARDSGIWVISGAPTGEGTAVDVAFQYRTGGSTTSDHGTEERASTWEWKSAPLREPTGRQLVVREVQIPAHAFNSATSTLAVTINGTTKTATLPSGRSIQKFLFKERNSGLDITIKAKSNAAAVEAPMIEGVRVGWRPGPLL